MTNAQLTARYNELSGKSIKPGSYSLARLAGMIRDIERANEAAAAIADEAAAFDKAAAELDKPAKQPKPRRSTDDEAIGAKEVFTLAALAKSLGIHPKIARARYRKHDNDGLRTKYIFPNTKAKIAEVTKIISPTTKTK